jgi:tRNA A-37 threonylcarbamoyl transferase component Bud32
MNTQCSSAILESALAGTLPTEDENSLHRHLEECEACSAALERMAGGTAWCHEAASLLGGDELDAAVPGRDDWSEIDFTVEYLEPTDEPNVLGRLGGYDVVEVIGHGGMSVVLKGFDRELKRYVAIKVLAPHLAQSSLAKKRFAREAQAAAAVVHPHVLAIHQVQPQGRLPFLVMPLVAGESLAQRLASRGVLELKEVLRIGTQVAAGLAAAHEQGLVHRDVKPANILLEKGIERAVLTDFGLARAADDVTLTRYGIIAGTPQYMSPEQARGETVDGRSDLFSLGCVLYEMASGVSPFRADSTLATLRRLIDEPPQALAALNPELPPWFVAIVDRLLEKELSRRFRSAKEVSELLEGCLAHVQQPANAPLPAGARAVKPIAPATRPAPRWSNRRRLGTMVAILLFSLGGFGAFLTFTGEPSEISGEWSGEDWARVVLRQTSPSEYAGTYTGTFGKKPGKIELKWSRIERRYNGTWSEGEDRFGKLSVRTVGDEIRGAWTTSRDSHINPGTPELADLLWVRAKAAAHQKDRPSGIAKKPPEVSLTFGPVLSRTLICPGDRAAKGTSLLPEGTAFRNGSALRLEDGRVFTLQTKSATGTGDISPEELAKWYDETKVNLIIDYRTETDQWELKLRNVRFAEVASIPSNFVSDWQTISANELQERFSRLEWRKTTDADTDPKGKAFQSLLFTRGEHPGKTFAFETSDGRRGILQFVTSTKKQGIRSASIRYKLLQQADTPANKDTPSGTGKKPPEASWAFAPVFNRTLICPGDRPAKGILPPEGSAARNGNALRLEDGKVFTLQTKSAAGKGDISPEELAKWYDETKVNLVIDYRTDTGQWELKLRHVKFAEVASTPSSFGNDWITMSANELQERYSKFEWRKTTTADTDPKGKGFQSLLLARGEQPGMTFAFETSDGHRGILQFVASNKKQSIRSALIRYKLLQPADTPAK